MAVLNMKHEESLFSYKSSYYTEWLQHQLYAALKSTKPFSLSRSLFWFTLSYLQQFLAHKLRWVSATVSNKLVGIVQNKYWTTVIIKYQCVEWKGDSHVRITTKHVALKLYL